MLDEEKTLIIAAQNGDQAAVASLYEKNKEIVYTHIYHRVGRKVDIAEDITADVFVQMVSNLHKYKVGKKPLIAWLYTIANNRVIDFYRKVDVRNRELQPAPTLQNKTLLPEAYAMQSDDFDSIQIAIEKLTEPQRDVLIYRFMNEMSVSETAQAMGRREGAIKTLTRRAIAAIKRQLEAGGYDV